ncbi:MAG TPA: pirin family protein [Beijerinckiaceae bacterium]|nr:pirin family protein [Beijerinckiaceae bacterium]
MTGMQDGEPVPGEAAAQAGITRIIVPRTSDVGGLAVRRALPAAGARMIGPFIFFDEFGPHEFLLGQGLDVEPHPHIGLETVTYLFDGEILHRDSLGFAQPIRPGDVNIMTAGRGIVHSERSPEAERQPGKRIHGLQVWTALPLAREEAEPGFRHHGIDELPRLSGEGKRIRLIMGSAYGEDSPVEAAHPTLYAECVLAPGAILPVDADYDERALYVVSGAIDIAGEQFGAGRLLLLRAGDRISVLALSNARLMLIGGEPMDGPRFIWWNFVASRKDRIDAAKADWSAGRFATVPGED